MHFASCYIYLYIYIRKNSLLHKLSKAPPGGLALFGGIVLVDALPLSCGGIIFGASLVDIRLPQRAKPVRMSVLRAPNAGSILLESFLAVCGAIIAAARLSANLLDFRAGVAPWPLSADILSFFALL